MYVHIYILYVCAYIQGDKRPRVKDQPGGDQGIQTVLQMPNKDVTVIQMPNKYVSLFTYKCRLSDGYIDKTQQPKKDSDTDGEQRWMHILYHDRVARHDS